MNVKQALQWAINELSKIEINFTEDEVKRILSFVLKTEKSFLYLNSQYELDPAQENKFKEYIAKRTQKIPTAYILGVADFYKHEFLVNNHVLIPRPETELLVAKVLANADKNKTYTFLDFGTGSGCIALSLLKELSRSKAILIDISQPALDVAFKNAERLNLLDRVAFINKSVTELQHNELQKLNMDQVDFVIANPPYISNISDDIEDSVKTYEPPIALFGGPKGWELYEQWAEKAWPLLKPGGFLYFEIGYDQQEPLAEIFTRQAQWEDINFYKDYAEKDRILILKKRGA
ncbi:MAG: peptide chain release factor N(5)-glutamine methyltransferase [Bdellovibrionales bacterium]|nr:peptide chain release factor N(5)-glutamine methyltransferase [Bdellovibrionales bacterium]